MGETKIILAEKRYILKPIHSNHGRWTLEWCKIKTTYENGYENMGWEHYSYFHKKKEANEFIEKNGLTNDDNLCGKCWIQMREMDLGVGHNIARAYVCDNCRETKEFLKCPHCSKGTKYVVFRESENPNCNYCKGSGEVKN